MKLKMIVYYYNSYANARNHVSEIKPICFNIELIMLSDDICTYFWLLTMYVKEDGEE